MHSLSADDVAAADELLPVVYDELRKLATAKLAHERPGQTLQATARSTRHICTLVASVPEGTALERSGHFCCCC
ncbi:MAG: ECF-type sigma factor [Pirellulales bacterium]